MKSQRGGVFQSGGSGFSTWKLKLSGFAPRSGAQTLPISTLEGASWRTHSSSGIDRASGAMETLLLLE